MKHETTVSTFDNTVRWNCTCGAMGRWPVADGSAQQEAATHVALQRKEQEA